VKPDETYVPVKGTIVTTTPDAVMLVVGQGRRVSIPRSLIHGADERELPKRLGVAVTLRIFEWKARELGLINQTLAGGADKDLFGGKL